MGLPFRVLWDKSMEGLGCSILVPPFYGRARWWPYIRHTAGLGHASTTTTCRHYFRMGDRAGNMRSKCASGFSTQARDAAALG